jgi:hypothetical protein
VGKREKKGARSRICTDYAPPRRSWAATMAAAVASGADREKGEERERKK